MAAPNGLIVGWPSTEASIPAGWSRVTQLDERFPLPRSWNDGSGRQSGQLTHTHANTYHSHMDYHTHAAGAASSGPSATYDANEVGSWPYATAAHTHAVSAGVVSTYFFTGPSAPTTTEGSNVDGIDRYTVIWIKSNGTTDIPINAIAWNSRSAGVPTNWAACDGTGGHPDLIGYFLMGAAREGGGGGTRTPGTGHTHTASHLHAHQATAHIHQNYPNSDAATVLGEVTGGPPPYTLGASALTYRSHGQYTAPNTSATHSADNTGTDASTSPSVIPTLPRYGLQHVQATAAVVPPRGLVALYDEAGALPEGWYLCDGSKANRPNLAGQGRYIIGTNLASIGEQSASDGHMHQWVHNHSAAAGSGHPIEGTGAMQNTHGDWSYVNPGSASIAQYQHQHTWQDTGGRNGIVYDQFFTWLESGTSAQSQPPYYKVYFIVYTGDKEIAAPTAAATGVGIPPTDIYTIFSWRVLAPPAVALGDAPSPLFTRLAVWEPPVVVPPTAEAIAEALSGTRGAVSTRYRFEERTMLYEFVADITDAVSKASVNLDNNRAVSRTAAMTIRPDRLPASFNVETSHIAVNSQLLVDDVWVTWALGLFVIDKISETVTPNGNVLWKANMADIGAHLFESFTSTSYTLPAGTNYIAEVERIVASMGMRFIIEPWPAVTPASFTWKANTAWGTIANDLLDAINFYPLYADDTGIIRTKFRRDPFREIPSIHYSTLAEPRMLRPELNRAKERGRYLNRVMVAISDSRFEPLTIEITNDDEDCPISTVYKGVTSAKVTADRCPDDTAMIELGAYELRDAAIKALTGDIITHPDPRRTNHEFYTLTIEDKEAATHWRCEGWKLDCEPGKTMQHEVGRADRVDVTLTAYLLGDQGAQEQQPEDEPPAHDPLPPPDKEPTYQRELDAPPP